MPHVDDGTLHALLDGALRAHEPDRADRVEAHLDTCADCRARLEAAADLRDRASDVLADLDARLASGAAADRGTGADGVAAAGGHEAGPTPRSGEPVPDFQEVLARAAGSGDENALDPTGVPLPGGTIRGTRPDQDPGLRRRYAWTRGLAWAATIVVALGTGYLVRDLADPTGVVPRAATMESSDRSAEGQPAAAEGLSASGAAATADVASKTVEAETGAAVPEDVRTAQQAAATAPEDARGAADAGQAAREAARVATEAEEDAAADAFAPTEVTARGEADERALGGEWRAASLEEAEDRAGSVLILPGAAVSTVELGADGSVRTRQRLPDSVVVVVVQGETVAADVQPADVRQAAAEPAPTGEQAAVLREMADRPTRLRAADAMTPSEAFPALVGLDLDSAAAAAAGPMTVTVIRDGRSLTLTAPLPEDVLLALAATASAREP